MVLAVEYGTAEGAPRWRTPNADWPALAATERPVWLVARANRLPELRTPPGREAIVEEFLNALLPMRDALLESGGQFAGFQMDYDSATEDLAHYAALMHAFREATPGVPWSITTLPAWLGSGDFAALVEGLDHFVLQVHAFDPPQRRDDAVTLCDPARVPRWLSQADALGVPFYTALPTYGYRLHFDAAGNFAGLQGEGARPVPHSVDARDLMANPAEIADIVGTIAADPPANSLGIAWFRLPIEGDRLNWGWPLLARVMEGEAPPIALEASVRNPQAGLFEIWVVNSGLYGPMEPIGASVDWINGMRMARDAVGGFRFVETEGGSRAILAGPAPAPGESTMAAWFRFGGDDNPHDPWVRVGTVEIMP